MVIETVISESGDVISVKFGDHVLMRMENRGVEEEEVLEVVRRFGDRLLERELNKSVGLVSEDGNIGAVVTVIKTPSEYGVVEVDTVLSRRVDINCKFTRGIEKWD